MNVLEPSTSSGTCTFIHSFLIGEIVIASYSDFAILITRAIHPLHYDFRNSNNPGLCDF